MDEKHFKNDAKQIVDLIHDTKLFKEDVTRDGMNSFEEFLEFLLSSKFNTYKKCFELDKKFNPNSK